jgi:hypothetical protein
VPVATVIVEGLLARLDGCGRELCAVSVGRCAVPEGCCALEPHPAASTTTAIAVTPAVRMG